MTKATRTKNSPFRTSDAQPLAFALFGPACCALSLLGGAARAESALVTRAGELSIVDGMAAVLGGADALEPARAILQSDVELRARLSLLGQDSGRALYGELPRSLLRATLEELIGEQLIAIEAERVKITPPGRADVAQALGELEREAGGHASVQRLLTWLGGSQRELQTLAERRALIAAFLRANLEGVSVVTEAEIDNRLRSDLGRFAAQNPKSARETVRAILAKDALRRTIEHWVRVLRARTRVRVLAVYDVP